MKYIDYVRRSLSGGAFPIFTISDLRIALKDRKISNEYLHVLIHNLLESGEIKKITKGAYTFHDNAAVVGFAFRPFYYGLESALSIRGMSGQGTNFVVVTARNVRVGVRSFEGRNYRIARIDKELLFGYGLVRYSGFWLPVSDLEKTVIDMVYFQIHIAKELIGEIKKNIDIAKMEKYLDKYDQGFRLKVINELRR
jgi:predicted transcriptional regulator of viral defense system